MKNLKQFLMMTLAGMVGAFFTIVLLGTSWTYTYDNATPPDTGESPRLGASRVRELKDALQERLNVCGFYPYTGTEISDTCAGEIRKLLIHEPIASTPTVAANHFDIRTKDVNSIAELVVTDENENELQITSGGKLLGDSLKDDSVDEDAIQLSNDSYIESLNVSGGGTAGMIKLSASDLVTLRSPAGYPATLSAATTPTADAHISSKKYVDDQISGIQDPTYTGGQSHTFDGGLIIKMGEESVAADTTDEITYGAAFPTGFVTANVSYKSTNIAGWDTAKVRAKSGSETSILQVTNAHSSTATIYWMAIGY